MRPPVLNTREVTVQICLVTRPDREQHQAIAETHRDDAVYKVIERVYRPHDRCSDLQKGAWPLLQIPATDGRLHQEEFRSEISKVVHQFGEDRMKGPSTSGRPGGGSPGSCNVVGNKPQDLTVDFDYATRNENGSDTPTTYYVWIGTHRICVEQYPVLAGGTQWEEEVIVDDKRLKSQIYLLVAIYGADYRPGTNTCTMQ